VELPRLTTSKEISLEAYNSKHVLTLKTKFKLGILYSNYSLWACKYIKSVL